MKKIILSMTILLTLSIVVKADKETTTTVTVPGTAVKITTNGPVTTIDCNQTIWDCYKQTTTTIERDGVYQIKPGSKVEIDATDQFGINHHIIGGFINETGGILSDGTIQHSFTLSDTWND